MALFNGIALATLYKECLYFFCLVDLSDGKEFESNDSSQNYAPQKHNICQILQNERKNPNQNSTITFKPFQSNLIESTRFGLIIDNNSSTSSFITQADHKKKKLIHMGHGFKQVCFSVAKTDYQGLGYVIFNKLR